jgi:hypothetical protein
MDHQAAPVLIALLDELGNLGIHLSLQRLGQHPPGALPHDLIDQRRRTTGRNGRLAELAGAVTAGRGQKLR